MRQVTSLINILEAKATTGTGNAIMVRDFDEIALAVSTASSANLTCKVQISNQDTIPDFSAAASPTNLWDYGEVINMSSGAPVDGATGIVTTGTDICRNYVLNNKNATWICATVTARTAGSINVKVKGFNNI
jgi:hypothetical protein